MGRRMQTTAWTALLVAVVFGAGCGDDAPSAPPADTTPAPTPVEQPDPAGTDTTVEGEAVAKEILDTFLALVDEVHALVKDKPAADDVLPQLQALVTRYEETMRALAQKRQGLPDVHAERTLRRYLVENRPPAVFRRDELLGEFVFHYRGVDAKPEVVEALTDRMIEVLNIAAS